MAGTKNRKQSSGHVGQPEIGRRSLMGGMSALVGAGMAGGSLGRASSASAATHSPGGTKIHTRFLEFDDPVEEFEAHFRIERDLVEDQGTALTWFYWLLYLVPGDRPPIPLLRYEGMEYSYFRKVADHTYRIHAHNISVPLSLETNDYMESMVNPLTEKRIATPTSLILNDPGTIQSPKGFRNVTGDGTYVEPYRQFRIENDLLKLDSTRTAPPDWPVNHIESSIQQVPYEMFLDKSNTSLPATSTGLYVFPYSKWLEMGDRPGHLLGYWDARKIPSPQDFPDKFLAKLEKDYPELLKPRWSEFDRPAGFAY